jgi:hypothetical protein
MAGTKPGHDKKRIIPVTGNSGIRIPRLNLRFGGARQPSDPAIE